ncbi:MAG: hypothetical protein OHK0039_42910 [Bacteroidia bacterium]
MRRFFRRLLRWILVLTILVGTLYLLRKPMLRGVGQFLIAEDASAEVQAAFVLSGDAYERCKYAATLYEQRLFPVVVAMGGNKSRDLLALGIERSDAMLAREALMAFGVDSAAIRTFEQGTSTYEESEQILGYAIREDLHSIMVISSRLHTRRISRVFGPKFRAAGIEVVIKGADPVRYEIDRWWESEEGLIFVNNEYLKLLYYALKY